MGAGFKFMADHGPKQDGDPQSFDSFADDYDRFTAFEDTPVWDWLASAGVAGGRRALDIGCGSGRRCIEFAKYFDEIVGLDLSAPLIGLARGLRPHPNVHYVVGDLVDFVDGEGFDLVFSSTTLHHLPDLDSALWHLRSLVRLQGSIVLMDNVAARPTPPRWVYRVGAAQVFVGDVRRFGWRDAYWLLRFRTGGPWLEHLATDRYLSRQEFEQRYGVVFPGGIFVDRGFAHAVVWRNEA
jgi:SAM-dependent methyltransferase